MARRTDPAWLTRHDDGVVVAVKAVPRASRTGVAGVQAGALRVQIAAAPRKGQSNAALIEFLADAAGCRPSAARLRRGSGGARKLIEIDGDPEALAARLAALQVP